VTTQTDPLSELAGIEVLKGHGTGNDFVLVPDLHGAHLLSPAHVRALCDRHTGIGADGVLRVVPTTDSPDVIDQAARARWFMDYRNGDGSVAEMCGNGARVFARYLVDAGLERSRTFAIATRGGVREIRIEDDGEITVDMGVASAPEMRAVPVVELAHRSWNGTGVSVPNPHCVVFLDEGQELRDLDLSSAPKVEPKAMFPSGVNVEFVVRVGATAERHVRMRVHERGAGETLSCGTGACAVMVATAARDEAPLEVSYLVYVPGGAVRVTRRSDEHLELRGPAVIVGRIVLGGLR